jgi:hypothetical protein
METSILKENFSLDCLALLIAEATEIPLLFHHSFYISNKYYFFLFLYICTLNSVRAQYFLPFCKLFYSFIFPPFFSTFITKFFLPSPFSLCFHPSFYLRFRFHSIFPFLHSLFLLYIPPCHSPDLHQNFI